MEDKDQSMNVHNNGVTLPDHDFEGLSHVISSAKPSLPATENGFIPLRDYDLRKPYETWEANLKEQQERLDNSPMDPATAIEGLKSEKKDIETKRDAVLDKRIGDYETFYNERRAELNDYHSTVVDLKNEKINQLRDRVAELKAENKDLEKQRDDERNLRLAELQNFHEQRIAELEQYHANELALTERFVLLMEQKHSADEQRIRDAETTLHEDRKNLFKTILDSVKESKLARLFK